MALSQGRQGFALHIDNRGKIIEMMDERGLGLRLVQGKESRRLDPMDFTEDG